MEELRECPICLQSSFQEHLKLQDYSITKEDFTLVKCASCGFVFTNPRPDQQEIQKYYQSEDYISHSNTNKGFVNKVYKWVRNYALNSKKRLLEKEGFRNSSILDYGSGTGEFLHTLKVNGWNTMGLEPNQDARDQAIKNYSLIIRDPAEINAIEDANFHVITLWHVLEHVHTLQNTLQQLKRILKQDGILVIAVPNPEAYETEVYGKYWAAYDVPRHLYHFTTKDIYAISNRIGMTVSNIQPMFFDPFYISMLSEKYMHGKTNYINALINGLKTTLKGIKKKESNSSLIYILRKTA